MSFTQQNAVREAWAKEDPERDGGFGGDSVESTLNAPMEGFMARSPFHSSQGNLFAQHESTEPQTHLAKPRRSADENPTSIETSGTLLDKLHEILEKMERNEFDRQWKMNRFNRRFNRRLDEIRGILAKASLSNSEEDEHLAKRRRFVTKLKEDQRFHEGSSASPMEEFSQAERSHIMEGFQQSQQPQPIQSPQQGQQLPQIQGFQQLPILNFAISAQFFPPQAPPFREHTNSHTSGPPTSPTPDIGVRALPGLGLSLSLSIDWNHVESDHFVVCVGGIYSKVAVQRVWGKIAELSPVGLIFSRWLFGLSAQE
ncbi:hypothetical protein FBEOM_5914 [Fusarium beomiforme]|uniref:Uncharacterized protein n=1 Tax=Fusarium beomiforme TaxID=44412 RepID=A0A9P5AK56_9HYPO|nr:hypothetical protein FBEOM_5914 [Fusarium beomiforme]